MVQEFPIVVPDRTRYVPLQQQPYSCCATCIQMISIRRGLTLLPAELIGWHLGLVVPPEDAHYFYNPRIASEPPCHGYGTQVGIDPALNPNLAFQILSLPIRMDILEYRHFSDTEEIIQIIEKNIIAGHDVILSILWGDVINIREVQDPFDPDALHIMLVDRVEDDYIRFVDPARGPKWRVFHKETIFQSLQQTKDRPSAGLWIVTGLDEKPLIQASPGDIREEGANSEV